MGCEQSKNEKRKTKYHEYYASNFNNDKPNQLQKNLAIIPNGQLHFINTFAPPQQYQTYQQTPKYQQFLPTYQRNQPVMPLSYSNNLSTYYSNNLSTYQSFKNNSPIQMKSNSKIKKQLTKTNSYNQSQPFMGINSFAQPLQQQVFTQKKHQRHESEIPKKQEKVYCRSERKIEQPMSPLAFKPNLVHQETSPNRKMKIIGEQIRKYSQETN